MTKQKKTISAPRDLRGYELRCFRGGHGHPSVSGHVLPHAIVLSIRTLTNDPAEARLLGVIELPRNVKPAALGAALMDAFSRQIDAANGSDTPAAGLQQLPYYKELEPRPMADDLQNHDLCPADRSHPSVYLFTGGRGITVLGKRPDTPLPFLVVFDRTVKYADTAAAVGSTVLAAIAAAIDAPEPKFSWESFAKICARAEDYLLMFYHKVQTGEAAGGIVMTRYELLDRNIPTKELGAAALAALLDMVQRPYAEREADANALFADRRASKILDQQESFPRVRISFDGAADREHIGLLAQDAHDNGSAGTTKVSSDCDGATLGAAIRKLFRKMGVVHVSATPPPLAKLYGKGGYRALVVRGEGKAALTKALDELRKLKMIGWAETPRSQGAELCAARLSESACEALDETLSELRSLAKRCRVAFTLVMANRTTDAFMFADLQATKVRRLLKYGITEQHSWSQVVGQPQAWEARAFQVKGATEARVRDTRSDVLITDAMKCAALAIAAAYETSAARR